MSDDFYAVHGINTHANSAAISAQRDAEEAASAAHSARRERDEAEEKVKEEKEKVARLEKELKKERQGKEDELGAIVRDIKHIFHLVLEIEAQVNKNTDNIQKIDNRVGTLEGKTYLVQNLLVNVANKVESGQEVQDSITSLFSALKEAILAQAEKSSPKQDIPEVKEFVSLVEKNREGKKTVPRKTEIYLNLPEDTVAFLEVIEDFKIRFSVIKEFLEEFFERDGERGILRPKTDTDLAELFPPESADMLYAMASRKGIDISEEDLAKFLSTDSEAKKIVEEMKTWDCPATKHLECSPLMLKAVDCFIEKNGLLDSQEDSLKTQSICN